MRGILVLLCSFVLFVSCGSSKKHATSHVEETYLENIEKAIENNRDKFTVEFITSELKEITSVRVIEYDTDKPVDEVTGKPPVKKETFIDSHKEQKVDEKKEENENEKTTILENDNINYTRNEDIKLEEIKSESKKIYYIALLLFGVILLLVVIYFLIKKFTKYG